jgi:hypothetical protein
MMTIQPPLHAGCTIGAMVLWAIALGSTPSLATDIAKGRKIAAAKCQMCHGLDGQAKLPAAPNLAGQTEGYLVAQMQAFHSGARKNDMMSLVSCRKARWQTFPLITLPSRSRSEKCPVNNACGILQFKPALRLERSGHNRQNQADQRDHSAPR